MSEFHELSAPLLDGKEQDFSAYKGKVVLVVNVASKCGFTPQYTGLEALWKKHQKKGLVIIGFPCNQFGAQEPGDADEIAQFCSLTYPVSFPLFAKVDVNGSQASPVFKHLTAAAPGLLGTKAIKWNFTKFLVNREGEVVKRYAPTDTPESIEADIKELL
jgi:glutathione peroxidase